MNKVIYIGFNNMPEWVRIRKLIYMDTKSKILIGLFILLVIGASVWKYKVFVVDRDFVIYNNIACDPYTEACFVYVCEEGDEECDDTPFKKIEKNAQFADLCDIASGEECSGLICESNEEGCMIVTCSEEALEDGEQCVKYEMPVVVETDSDTASSTTDQE